jgi:hypothetical protein
MTQIVAPRPIISPEPLRLRLGCRRRLEDHRPPTPMTAHKIAPIAIGQIKREVCYARSMI